MTSAEPGEVLEIAQPLAPRPARDPDGEATQEEAQEEVPTDQLIVQFHPSRSRALAAPRTRASQLQALRSAAHAQGLVVIQARARGQDRAVLKLEQALPATQLRPAAQALAGQIAGVRRIEPDLKAQPQRVPTDPLYSQQWHYQGQPGSLNLAAAWDLSTGQDVVVGVVDTGVLPHADLSANLLSGRDFISSASAARDGDGRDGDGSDAGDGCSSGQSSWHGTHVAGTIAAAANNGQGGAGVAWDALLLPVRVLGCGGGYTSDITDGMRWAAGLLSDGTPPPSQPAKVLNLSLGGGGGCPSDFQSAIDEVMAAGVSVVVAAGNSNAAVSGFFPANCRGVITVASVGRGGARAPYSNYGPRVDVAAPGGNMAAGTAMGVLSTHNSGSLAPGADSYQFLQGTSMAAPHISGLVALMLARNPNLRPDEIRTLLRSTARAFPVTCSGCGTGIANAAAAVAAANVGAAVASAAAEQEPNDAHAQAQTLGSLPVKLSGHLGTLQDVDTYKVRVAPGVTVTARLLANPAANLSLVFRNAANVVMLRSDRAAGLADRLSWRNGSGAGVDLFIRIVRVTGTPGASTMDYTLEVAR
ncbi:S8 family serine peptidase [Ideonella livida]|uniref:S8 family serine peptidase n=1 Tax=Ideonella livida TaxID=2707176 RepID=A0A7C9PH64_9BURK|nr:S8 family serine peptidase [Ideonella livida]NDY90934.1 S8 family serine peptidase [Ideonella livida]